jgi:hypothetical protein
MIVMHELAHWCVLLKYNNYNVSSPTKSKEKTNKEPERDPRVSESGRVVIEEIFGAECNLANAFISGCENQTWIDSVHTSIITCTRITEKFSADSRKRCLIVCEPAGFLALPLNLPRNM